jgi:hypothetical protein
LFDLPRERLEAAFEFNKDFVAYELNQFFCQRLDYRSITHVGPITFSATPGHRRAVISPVRPRPSAKGCGFRLG